MNWFGKLFTSAAVTRARVTRDLGPEASGLGPEASQGSQPWTAGLA